MWTGVVVAYIFTSIPAWTTWVLLVAMALYDLFAVLTPQGPLQILVNLAVERDQEIPALVYEAREVRRPRRRAAAAAPTAATGSGADHNDVHGSAAGAAEAALRHDPAHADAGGIEEEVERPVYRGSNGARAVGEATEEGVQMVNMDTVAAAGQAVGPGWPVGSAGGNGALSHELARLHRPPVRPRMILLLNLLTHVGGPGSFYSPCGFTFSILPRHIRAVSTCARSLKQFRCMMVVGLAKW